MLINDVIGPQSDVLFCYQMDSFIIWCSAVNLTPLSWRTSSSLLLGITTRSRSTGLTVMWGSLLDSLSTEWRTQSCGTMIRHCWVERKLRRRGTANTTLVSGTRTFCLNQVSVGVSVTSSSFHVNLTLNHSCWTHSCRLACELISACGPPCWWNTQTATTHRNTDDNMKLFI